MSVESPTPVRPRIPRALAVFAGPRIYRELLFALLGLGIGIAGFTITITLLSIGVGLAVTFLGLPLLAIGGIVARWQGGGVRLTANRLLGTDVEAPAPPRRRGSGLLGYISTHLLDGAAWRARVYLLLALPLGILGFTVAVTFYSYGLGGVTYALWRPFLPTQPADDGSRHRGASFGTNYFLDTPGRIAGVFVVGALGLLAAPWIVRGALAPHRAAVRLLLGPGSGARVSELERTRAVAVDESAATLRRIERDLHDGAQARMVAVAMNVGLAREKLAEGTDPAGATRLLDSAHASAKEAITELRDLARGIHPPVLDTGLESALRTLVTHSAVPVDLRCSLADRLDPAIETMAYFCVAELLANAAKHSGADRIDVDGRLRLDSPPGGPTTVAVDVPVRTRTP